MPAASSFPLLRALLVASTAAACAAACSSNGEASSTSATDAVGAINAPPEWDRSTNRPTNEAAAVTERQACQFGRGNMPSETIGADIPVTASIDSSGNTDANIPIQNIVVLMQENRSFDSYFGHMNQYRQNIGLPAGVDTPADTGYTPPSGGSPPTNPGDSSQSGGLAPWQHAPHMCAPSTNHEWFGAHLEVDNGAMDGFFTTNDGYTDDCKNGPYPCASQNKDNTPAHSSWGTPSSTAPLPNGLLTGERALYYYTSDDLPFYYALATSFAIGDEYHSSLQGPTWPNRDYLYMASSRGVTTNVHPTIPDFPGTDVLIFDELEKRHVSWKVYMDGGIPGLGTITDFFVKRWNITGDLKDNLEIHFHTSLDFYVDAKLGKLPQVAFVDPKLAFENDHLNNDEHPPGDIQDGQLFVSKIVHAVMNGPQWPTTAMFLTYDENGGEYDHVAPPAACAPMDSLDPNNPGTIQPDLRFPNDQQVGPADAFTQYGARVPFTVISPFVKSAGYVSHNVYDHTSIVRFIEAKFKIPALTARDANADALFDFFDFSNPQNPPLLALPSVLNYDPANPLNAVVDQNGQSYVDADEKSYCNALINMP